jgi:hypothetical protein
MPHQTLSANERRHVPTQAPRPPQGSCRSRSAAPSSVNLTVGAVRSDATHVPAIGTGTGGQGDYE